MSVRSDQRSWVRKLDGNMHVVPEQPQSRLYPGNLDEVLESFRQIRNPPLGAIPQARAIGSHWCASKAGVTPGYMLETATPVHESDGNQAAARLNHILYDVIPGCLTSEALRFFLNQPNVEFHPSASTSQYAIYLCHVEAGARIYELYSALDGFRDGAERDEASFPESLAGRMRVFRGNDDYAGPWAMETMGGAGGQTIGGVISTATHGGDLAFGAISDSVVAMHLIGADGQHHWIERTRLGPTNLPLKLVDDVKLKQLYRHPDYGEIHYHQDDNLMNAAVVACGRMGMIYSLVLRVRRQYALHEHCVVSDWRDVKTWITNPANPVFDPTQNRFARIDINTYGGFWNPGRRRCYVITRTFHELDMAGKPPLGRKERAGLNAGRAAALGTGDGYFDDPCASDNWLRTALSGLRHDFVEIRDDAITVWLIAEGVILFWLTPPPVRAVAMAAQAAAAATIAAMEALILTVELLIAALPTTMHFGDTVAVVLNMCAQLNLLPILGEIYERTSESLHEYDSEHPRTPAISYAAMDEHNYLNVGCVAPGDTIEFFLDADSPDLPTFIDHVLGRVLQVYAGLFTGGQFAAFGGYISLRFMNQSQATLAMQQWPRTCSIEIAGLSRVLGTGPFLQTLEEDAKKFGALFLHWGQRNNWPMREIEKRYGSTAPLSPMFKWRSALSGLTDHGRYAAFSTEFSKHKGLEITTPVIKSFGVVPTEGCAGKPAMVTWEAASNPRETEAFLIQTPAAGPVVRTQLLGLSGSQQVALSAGKSTWSLRLERWLNGELFVDQQDVKVRGVSANEEWSFELVASPRVIDGVNRWAAEINLFSQFISNDLRVSSAHSTFAGIPSWRLRNPAIGDVPFTTAAPTRALPALPRFNTNWLVFSEAAAAPGPGPTVRIDFTLTCV